MARTTRTHKELQKIISRMIHSVPSVKMAGARIAVPLPSRCWPDSTGCNWTMPRFGTRTDHVSAIEAVLQAARAKFSLAE